MRTRSSRRPRARFSNRSLKRWARNLSVWRITGVPATWGQCAPSGESLLKSRLCPHKAPRQGLDLRCKFEYSSSVTTSLSPQFSPPFGRRRRPLNCLIFEHNEANGKGCYRDHLDCGDDSCDSSLLQHDVGSTGITIYIGVPQRRSVIPFLLRCHLNRSQARAHSRMGQRDSFAVGCVN